MNNEAQRIAIAEACDWKPSIGPVGEWIECPPDYLTDLNAMHEAEKVLNPTQSETFAGHLLAILGIPQAFVGTARGTYVLIHATAAQRAEAFLRTIGKWNDSK